MSDIYFSTSNHEGLSISALEALYLKKHLVLSNCPGNKEINAACSFHMVLKLMTKIVL